MVFSKWFKTTVVATPPTVIVVVLEQFTDGILVYQRRDSEDAK